MNGRSKNKLYMCKTKASLLSNTSYGCSMSVVFVITVVFTKTQTS